MSARRLKRVAIVVAGGVMLLAALGASHEGLATGMLVLAPAPLAKLERPQDASGGLEIERAGVQVRAWVFDPKGAPRGTVLLLHGIRSSKLHLVSAAREHALRGRRAIAVDSRGHGESSGRYLTYGVEEARDLVALVDELQRRELLVPPLAIVGTSYGAATALQYAAIDPRAERVVAIAPFASLRQVVPAYLQWKLGPLSQLIPSGTVDGLIDGATRQAGFAADLACPRCAAEHVKAAVLLIHSRDDERIPFQHSIDIRAALGSPADLMLLDGPDHVGTGGAPGVAEAIQRFLTTEKPRTVP